MTRTPACRGRRIRLQCVLCLFQLFARFDGGEIAAVGLAVALNTSRDALGSGLEMEDIQRECNAAVAPRGL